MVSKVCSRSQGQPPGARSRAMMDTNCSNFSPALMGNFYCSSRGSVRPPSIGSITYRWLRSLRRFSHICRHYVLWTT